LPVLSSPAVGQTWPEKNLLAAASSAMKTIHYAIRRMQAPDVLACSDDAERRR
jgi:hypothetical protein